MTFIQFCVGFVILLIILFASGGLSALMSINFCDDSWSLYAWFLTSLGFAVCLTILLYQNGIIN